LNHVFANWLGWGVPGLALSTAMVALSNFGLLLARMRRKIQRLEGRALLQALLKIGIATAVMAVAARWVESALHLNRYLDLLGSIGAAVIVFGAVCRILRVSELAELIAVIAQRPKSGP